MAAAVIAVGQPELGRAACNGGETTIAGACANAFPRPPDGSAQPFYPWDSQSWNYSATQDVIQRLSPANCPTVRVRNRDSSRGFVEITCGNSGPRLLVNEDSLACSANNIAEHPNLLFSNDVNACTSFGVYNAADPNNLTTLRTFVSGLSEGTPRRILERAIDRFSRNRELVNHDMDLLGNIWDQDYQASSGEAGESAAAARIGERFRRALDSLKSQSDTAREVFGPDCKGRISGLTRTRLGGATEATQARRSCRLLTQAHDYYDSLWREATARAEREIEDQHLVLNDQQRAHFIRTRAGRMIIERIQANTACGDTVANNDDMAFRMFLYSGLSSEERSRISPTGLIPDDQLPLAGKLALFRWNTEYRGFGRLRAFGEITNGYVYGGHREIGRGIGIGGTGKDQAGSYAGTNDCSTFVAGLFHPGARGIDAPTTADFEAISKALAGRSLSSDERERFQNNRNYASCLEAVDYRTTAPQPSDILVNRTAGDAHIVVIHSYDRNTGNVRTLEAAGSSVSNNTIDFTMERTIYEPSCLGADRPPSGDWQVRPVRAGLSALRFKANPPASCPLSQS